MTGGSAELTIYKIMTKLSLNSNEIVIKIAFRPMPNSWLWPRERRLIAGKNSRKPPVFLSQENIIRGGQRDRSRRRPDGSRMPKSRAIKGIDEDMKLNKAPLGNGRGTSNRRSTTKN